MPVHLSAARSASRLCLASVVLALAACNRSPAPEVPATVVVTDALCRPTLNGRDVTACYVTPSAGLSIFSPCRIAQA